MAFNSIGLMKNRLIITVICWFLANSTFAQNYINSSPQEIRYFLESNFSTISISDSLLNVHTWQDSDGEIELDSVFILYGTFDDGIFSSFEFHFGEYSNFCDSIILNLRCSDCSSVCFHRIVDFHFEPIVMFGEFDVLDKRKVGSFKPEKGKREIHRCRIKLSHDISQNSIHIWVYGLKRKELRLLKKLNPDRKWNSTNFGS